MPLSDWAKSRQKVRSYIYKKVKDSGKFKVPENRRLITREVFENVEKKFLKIIDVTKEELDKEIDRCLDDPSYLNLR